MTILNLVYWPETMVDSRNELSHPNEKEIASKLKNEQMIDASYLLFGHGHVVEKIVNAIASYPSGKQNHSVGTN